MSIVIKGAKLPNNCGACPLRLAWCTERLYMVARPERCPLEPERTGKWIEHDDGWDGFYYDCSACGDSWTTIDGTPWDNGMNYCPNCGARMEEKL